MIFKSLQKYPRKGQAAPPVRLPKEIDKEHIGDIRKYQLFVVDLLHISRPLSIFFTLSRGGVKLLRLVLCSGKGFADRGLFLPVQLLCGKLLKRCGHNVRVPAFEKHKVTGLLALNLF